MISDSSRGLIGLAPCLGEGPEIELARPLAHRDVIEDELRPVQSARHFFRPVAAFASAPCGRWFASASRRARASRLPFASSHSASLYGFPRRASIDARAADSFGFITEAILYSFWCPESLGQTTMSLSSAESTRTTRSRTRSRLLQRHAKGCKPM